MQVINLLTEGNLPWMVIWLHGDIGNMSLALPWMYNLRLWTFPDANVFVDAFIVMAKKFKYEKMSKPVTSFKSVGKAFDDQSPTLSISSASQADAAKWKRQNGKSLICLPPDKEWQNTAHQICPLLGLYNYSMSSWSKKISLDQFTFSPLTTTRFWLILTVRLILSLRMSPTHQMCWTQLQNTFFMFILIKILITVKETSDHKNNHINGFLALKLVYQVSWLNNSDNLAFFDSSHFGFMLY